MSGQIRSLCMVLGILLAPAVALATDAPSQQQASMVVTGTITVNPQGGVANYTLHDSGKLPASVQQLIKQAVPAWRFKPVLNDGAPVTAITDMSLRVLADISGPDNATLRIGSARFGCDVLRAWLGLSSECQAESTVSFISGHAPAAPIQFARRGIGGRAILVLKIGRDGRVAHAAVQEVDLDTELPDAARYRKILATQAIAAAHEWRFDIPLKGTDASADSWIVRIPVEVERPVSEGGGFGVDTFVGPDGPAWHSYVLGPVNPIPWDGTGPDDAAGAAAAARSVAFKSDSRFVLLTQTRSEAAPDAGAAIN